MLQAIALQTHGEQEKAVHLLCDALALAEPGGFIRTFVDEGLPMVHLLSAAAAHGRMPDYIGKLMAVFKAEEQKSETTSYLPPPAQSLIEPLSRREVEILQLIAQGLSNQEISERLVLALDTVKGHNKKIFGKLQVQRRTEAVARARELGLLVQVYHRAGQLCSRGRERVCNRTVHSRGPLVCRAGTQKGKCRHHSGIEQVLLPVYAILPSRKDKGKPGCPRKRYIYELECSPEK